jgi:hypothetical protein
MGSINECHVFDTHPPGGAGRLKVRPLALFSFVYSKMARG